MAEDLTRTYQWLDEVLTKLLRHCMELGLDQVCVRLSQAKTDLGDYVEHQSQELKQDRVTLMLTLEACTHVADELKRPDVRQAIALAMDLLEGPDQGANILKFDPQGTLPSS